MLAIVAYLLVKGSESAVIPDPSRYNSQISGFRYGIYACFIVLSPHDFIGRLLGNECSGLIICVSLFYARA